MDYKFFIRFISISLIIIFSTACGLYGNLETSEKQAVVIVTDDVKQQLKLGIDAERLWSWHRDMKDTLAKVAVEELNPYYVRVAINAAYEREKGNINERAYRDELILMQSYRDINPNIKFFASPRPLFEAYKKRERAELWGHAENVPWSPYPVWILPWREEGTRKMKDGSVVTRWRETTLDIDALVQYFADYLNLMHSKGFDIDYMDFTNEKQVMTQSQVLYFRQLLPTRLQPNVKMPLLVGPSTWDVYQGTQWLLKVDRSKNEHQAFDVAATHNTGKKGSLVEFVQVANDLDKEAWNSEMHEWFGVDLKDEIMTSDILWQHIQAGFTGIDTWLFYGPPKGRGHTMIWVDRRNNSITRSGKYEIFKQLVNNANEGYHISVNNPLEDIMTTAIIKDNILSLWVLNKGTKPVSDVLFDLGQNRQIKEKQNEVYRWHHSLPRVGEYHITNTSDNSFQYTIEAGSLYFFKITL